MTGDSMKKMTRRKFLTLFRGAPMVAAPSLALSAVALNETSKTTEKLNNVVVEGDKTVFQHCNFDMKGALHLNGNHQTVMQCHFRVEDSYGIKARELTKAMEWLGDPAP